MIVRINMGVPGSAGEMVELFTQEEIDEFNFKVLPLIREHRGDTVRMTIFWRGCCDFVYPSWLLGAFAHYGKRLSITTIEEPEPEFEYLGDSIDTGDVELIDENFV